MPIKSQRKKKPPELKVFFDTNVLWTGSASDLLKQEVLDLIKTGSQHSDLTVSWYLPDIVRHERQFQMLTQSLQLLPAIKKLERLLGHNLNITEHIIEQRVNETVESQITDLSIKIVSLDTTRVDWNRLILNAAYRRPPFSQGEKEKGFRDSLLAETFLQLVTDSPVTPKVCRIGLVTNDGLLSETISQRTKSQSNVRVLSSLEELKSLINTLVSEVSEEFVARVQAKAQAYFFEVDQKDTIYYKEDIDGTIRETYWKDLNDTPLGAQVRENGLWYVRPPRFLKKKGQRVSWASRITVEAKAYKYDFINQPSSGYPLLSSPETSAMMVDYPFLESSMIPLGGGLSNPTLSHLAHATSPLFPSTSSGQLSILSAGTDKVLVKTGKSIFEVAWSVTVTATGKLSSPKIDSVKFIETSWE